MSVLNDFVLTLNRAWVPLDTCTVSHAFSRLFSETAKFIDTDTYQMHDAESWIALPVRDGQPCLRTWRLSIRVPEVIVLTSGVIQRAEKMAYSRRSLLRRDRNTCQYCAQRPGIENLTIDHVLPRKKGGRTSWTNCVMACKDCNCKKGHKLLDEAGMSLIHRPEMKILHPMDPSMWARPYEPTWSPLYRVSPAKFKQSWTRFVSDKLESTMAQTYKEA